MGEFKNEIKDRINLIQCPSSIGEPELKDLSGKISDWSTQDVLAHVFNFEKCDAIPPGLFKRMILFKQSAGAANVRIYSIGLSAALIKEIENGGLDAAFNPTKDLNAVLLSIGQKNTVGPTVSAISAKGLEFIKPFVAAVKIAISTQANTPLTSGKPFPKKNSYDIDIGIAAVINLVSPQFIGSVSLLFPQEVFLDIYFNMLEEKIDSITMESEDAAAELLNIIFGLAKMKLNNDKGFAIQKSIPTVLVGERLRIALSHRGATVSLPFETKAGTFYVEVLFDEIAGA